MTAIIDDSYVDFHFMIEDGQCESKDEGFAILNQRMNEISREIFKECKSLNIKDQIQIVFNTREITPNPHVRKNEGKIFLEIPLLFLLEQSDLHPKTPVAKWVYKNFSTKHLPQKDLLNLKIFQIFIKDANAADKAKKFVIAHELAHVMLGHLDKFPTKSMPSKIREKQADLLAVKLLKDTQGAIYLFSIMSQFEMPPSDSHPSYQERLEYIQQI